MGNSFGKINDVTFSSTEQFSAAIYFYFAGFHQKCFIGRAMKVRRRNVARRNEKPQHTKGVSRLFPAVEYVSLGQRTLNFDAVDERDGFRFTGCFDDVMRNDPCPEMPIRTTDVALSNWYSINDSTTPCTYPTGSSKV
jgi:hypothetical protein